MLQFFNAANLTNHPIALSNTVKDAYLSDELQHSLDTLHHPLSFTADQHHPVCRLGTTLLKKLDAGLCVLETKTQEHMMITESYNTIQLLILL